MGKLKRRSLKTQMITSFFLFAIVPLLIVGGVSIRAMDQILLKEGENYSKKLMNSLTDSIDEYIVDMVNLSILPMYDMDVRSVMEDTNNYYILDDYSQMYRNEKLNNFMFMLNNLRTEIDGVFIYCADGRVYHNIMGKGAIGQYNYNYNYDYTEDKWYQLAKEQNGKSVILAPRLQKQVLPGDKTVFSIGRIIRSLNSGKESGAILIDVNFSKIENLCQGVIYGEDEYVTILDNENQIIYSTLSEPNLDYQNLMEKMGESSSVFFGIDGRRYLITVGYQGYTDWRTLRIVAVDNLIFSANQVRKGFTFLLIGCTIIQLFLIFVGEKEITVPIKNMCYKMKLVERGNLDVRVDVSNIIEIEMLGNSFNVMVENLNDSLHRMYQVELEKKQAQLMALQSQINPHFLYNTLDSIHMMAELNCDYEVGVMVTSLAKMMRYSFGAGGFMAGVRIGEELEYVRNYMALQKIRLENKVDLDIEVPENIKEYTVPKLILQPIVENSVTHGLKDLDEICIVKIEAWLEEADVVLRISDNGNGMSEARLAFVRSTLESAEKDIKHESIGLKNVHDRIRVSYGSEYGIRIVKSDKTGSIIEICIPARKDKLGE